MRVETFLAGKNLHTTHPGEAYAPIRTVRPGPEWTETILVPTEGQSFTALGGEHCFAYDTADGAHAEGFMLAAGDRATLVRTDLPHSFVEWRVERAGD
jgi:hypothetical protein